MAETAARVDVKAEHLHARLRLAIRATDARLANNVPNARSGRTKSQPDNSVSRPLLGTGTARERLD